MGHDSTGLGPLLGPRRQDPSGALLPPEPSAFHRP
jgi:hypothetical protein